MPSGSCLCGAHRFAIEGPLQFNHFCHCGYCRKQFGSLHSALIGVPVEQLTWERGDVVAYTAPGGFARESCATCGSPMPEEIEGMPRFLAAGCFPELEASFEFHIFVASKAAWEPIADDLPQFDAYPPGVESETFPTLPAEGPADATRGSCLCGAVRYAVDGPGITARHCHCTRCRQARGAGNASNWIVALDDFRLLSGADSIRRYKVPEAKYFTQSFCGGCGATVPTIDEGRGIAIVPFGGLDDEPPKTPVEHIWTADKASWNPFQDDLPRREGPPEG